MLPEDMEFPASAHRRHVGVLFGIPLTRMVPVPVKFAPGSSVTKEKGLRMYPPLITRS